jgi:hypothetical protein
VIPETINRQRRELAERLQAGWLQGLGPVDLGDGAPLDAPLAARAIIGEARHLAERIENGQPVSPWRWRLISEQLDRLRRVIH